MTSQQVEVIVHAVADLPTLDAPLHVTVDENSSSQPFSLSTELTDLDGSESLLIQLTDIPIGVTISDGTNSFTGSVAGDVVVVTDWNLSQLTVTPVAGSEDNFELTIVSRSTEAANDDTATGSQTIGVTVNPVNDVPVAVDDAYVLQEDETLVVTDGVLANDFDGEGDQLTAQLVTGPVNGTVVLQADGTFTYLPNSNFHGTDSFTYQAGDGQDLSSIATVYLTIVPVAEAPIAEDDYFTVDEDNVLSAAGGGVLANDFDADGDALSALLLTGPTHGALEFNDDGTFTYRPDADYHGEDSFTYLASDGAELSDLATVHISVISVNDIPEVGDFAYEINEDTQLDVSTGGLLAGSTDVENEKLTPFVVEGARNGQVEVRPDGSFQYTPNQDFSGVDHFTYRAHDGGDDSNLATVEVTVNPMNDSPQGGGNEYFSIEDQMLHVTDQGVLSDDYDSDGDSLTAMLVTGPQHGELTFQNDGTFAYSPDGGFTGEDTFTYVANDGTVDSEVVTVTIRVLPQVLPPTIEIPTTQVTENLPDLNPNLVPNVPVVPTSDNTPSPNQPSTTIRDRGESRFVEVVTGSGDVEYDEIEIGTRGLIDWQVEPRRLRLEPAAIDAIDPMENVDEGGLLWESLDHLAERAREMGAARMLIVGSALILTALGSIAYTIWTVWCGFLTTSILTLMPGWKLLDPVPVLDEDDEPTSLHAEKDDEDDDEEDDDESLASLVESSNTH